MKLNLRSVDLNLLTVFDALMESGKLSLAAERLGMSQPAVSAALARLRISFRDELFVRSRSGMLPTPRAQALHQDIREALHLVRRAITGSSAFDPTLAERSFTILGDSFFESAIIGRLINQLSESAPGVRIETTSITLSDPVQALRSLNADVLLDYEELISPQLMAQEVAQETLVVITARQHPRIKRRPSMKAFLREHHVILTRRHRSNTSLEHALGGVSLNRRIKASVQHYSSMPIIVAQTDCIATVPRRLGALYEAAFDVRCHLFPIDIAPIPMWMYWPKVMHGDAAHQWLRDRLIEVLQ